MTYEDTIRRVIHIESEDDLGDTSFTYYLDADIGDTVFVCEDADVYMREDKNGWAIYWHNNLMDSVDASDEDDKEAYVEKYRKAKEKYIKVCNASLDGTLEKECLSGDEDGQPSFDYSNASEIFKQFSENKKPLLNEAETTKYMACCYDPEDYYEETNYISEDGELSCNSSGAKLFNTEDEAVEYADENKPIGWMSFAMPFKTTLNEADATMPKRIKESINEGDKFKNKNGAIIEIIEYDEDENYVLYKVNDKFYDTHIDSIENILSKNGYEKLNESKRRFKESREDTIFDIANECSKILGVPYELPKFRIRNFGTDLVSYNGPKNTIFYHSDLLYISDETFVRTIIAHEMAHWAVGYEHNHDEVWVEAADRLEDSLGDKIYGIFENIDQYDLSDIFKGLESGKVMKKFLEVYPEIENHYKIGFNTEFGDLVSYNNGVLTIRPTFYCTNDTKYVTEDQWNIAGVEAETLIDEED